MGAGSSPQRSLDGGTVVGALSCCCAATRPSLVQARIDQMRDRGHGQACDRRQQGRSALAVAETRELDQRRPADAAARQLVRGLGKLVDQRSHREVVAEARRRHAQVIGGVVGVVVASPANGGPSTPRSAWPPRQTAGAAGRDAARWPRIGRAGRRASRCRPRGRRHARWRISTCGSVSTGGSGCWVRWVGPLHGAAALSCSWESAFDCLRSTSDICMMCAAARVQMQARKCLHDNRGLGSFSGRPLGHARIPDTCPANGTHGVNRRHPPTGLRFPCGSPHRAGSGRSSSDTQDLGTLAPSP